LSDADSLEDIWVANNNDVTSLQYSFATPTSSMGSPREWLGSLLCQDECLACQPECASLSEASCESAEATAESMISSATAFHPTREEPELGDVRIAAVTSSIQSALSSFRDIHHIRIEQGASGPSSLLISAELNSHSQTKAYDVMQLAKKSLEAISSQLESAKLLSARVQKEERGYSMRSSIACLPDHAYDKLCWDIFRSGHCPRRSTCRWYHPQDADIRRVKVSIKSAEVASEAAIEEKMASAKKHKISLGELIP